MQHSPLVALVAVLVVHACESSSPTAIHEPPPEKSQYERVTEIMGTRFDMSDLGTMIERLNAALDRPSNAPFRVVITFTRELKPGFRYSFVEDGHSARIPPRRGQPARSGSFASEGSADLLVAGHPKSSMTISPPPSI